MVKGIASSPFLWGLLDHNKGRLDRMDGHLDRMEGHLERIEGRLFDMQKALTVQTRWLLTFLVAVPVIYSLLQKLLGILP